MAIFSVAPRNHSSIEFNELASPVTGHFVTMQHNKYR